MLTAAWLWVVAARLWNTWAAWVASVLFCLDLAVWHHVGRARFPASFGAALATAALLYVAHRVEDLTDRRRILVAGAGLALGVLGYSSLAVLFGLFGIVLLALLFLDAEGLTPEARKGAAAALVVGGALAFVTYYGHYLPGLLGGGVSDIEAETSVSVGRTVFGIFRNEGRQSYRLWLLGFGYVISVGLLGAPFALARVRASARPVLLAWLGAWALVMLLKDPLFLPNLLRWGKEDQFVSPLICLLVGGAVGSLDSRIARWTLAGLAIGAALWLEARDFSLHAVSLEL
jgi:hypothetical protein